MRRFLKEELPSNQVKIPFMNRWLLVIIWKVNPFVASVTCSRYQIAFKWSVNFWLQLLSIRWDGKYFYLNILQIQENWADRNFITHNELACVLTAHLYATSKSADWNQQQLTDGGILANRNNANHPYCFLSNQKKVQILAFCMWSVKEMYHALFPRYRGRAWSQASLLP